MFDLVIFDMDGVIINSEPIYKKIEQKIFKRLNLNISKEKHNEFTGMSDKEAYTKLKKENNLVESVDELLDMLDSYEEKTLQELLKLDLIDGIEELINNCIKNNIKIAVASSSPLYKIESILKKNNIYDKFDFIISGEEVKKSKPAPDIFLKVSEELNIEPKKCVVIEDSSNGVKATKKANMYSIAYKNLDSGNQDLSNADEIVENIREIIIKKDEVV